MINNILPNICQFAPKFSQNGKTSSFFFNRFQLQTQPSCNFSFYQTSTIRSYSSVHLSPQPIFPSIRLSSILLPRPILSFPLPLPLRLKSRSVRRTNHEVYIANSPDRCATGTGRKRAAFSKRSNVYTRSRVYTSIEASLLLAASPYPGVNEQRRCARRHTLGERGDHGSFSRSDRERQGWRRRRRKKIPLPCNDASAATVVRGGSIPIAGPCRKGRRRGWLPGWHPRSNRGEKKRGAI